MTKKALGSIIKYYRYKKQLSQREFSKIIGCSFSTMSKIESGKQAAKSELVLSILSRVLPNFKSDLLLVEAEAELHEQKPVVY